MNSCAWRIDARGCSQCQIEFPGAIWVDVCTPKSEALAIVGEVFLFPPQIAQLGVADLVGRSERLLDLEHAGPNCLLGGAHRDLDDYEKDSISSHGGYFEIGFAHVEPSLRERTDSASKVPLGN